MTAKTLQSRSVLGTTLQAIVREMFSCDSKLRALQGIPCGFSQDRSPFQGPGSDLDFENESPVKSLNASKVSSDSRHMFPLFLRLVFE
jgi:hypothetical protein